MAERVPAAGQEAATDVAEEIERPRMFRVLMHNDDYTTMDFVVAVLRAVFRRSPEDAVRIMLNIHHEGLGVCGVYPAEVAETKIATVHERSRDHGFPLRCSMEPD
ncbi:MAG: ATP-dependent Clp protease adaptor ClpS [Candidatus Hydrogenedentes bacterium]|nr:ATP-dependent Clp protease adaptor ClpS [Candidatus Hydrogenedentota bacterium]